MTIGSIIQARLNSKRFPGKVLTPLAGKPILQYLLERAESVRSLGFIIVGTSDKASDDQLASWCEARGTKVVRGSLGRVADRFGEVVQKNPCDAFIRLSGDSPLLDPLIIKEAIDHFTHNQVDIVTNVWPTRTYPPGQSVEILRTSTFLSALPSMIDIDDQQHVTPYLYRHANRFRIHSFTHHPSLRHFKFTVDVPADHARLEHLIKRMTTSHLNYHLPDLIQLCELVSSV